MRHEKLSPREVGSLLDGTTGLVGNILCFIPVLALFLGLSLASGAAHQAATLSDRGALPTSYEFAVIAIVAVGFLLAVASAWFGLMYPTAIGNLWLRRLAAWTVARRVAPLVDPRDSEAAFVEVVPRDHWGATMLDTATEIGFLQVDVENRELLFEGNGERWRLPAEAIVSCEVEGPGTLQAMITPLSYAVVRTRGEEWPAEIPLAPRGRWAGQFIRKSRRRHVASELCVRIRSLLQEAPPKEPRC